MGDFKRGGVTGGSVETPEHFCERPRTSRRYLGERSDHKFTFLCTNLEREALRAAASRNGKSVSAYVREAIRLRMAETEQACD